MSELSNLPLPPLTFAAAALAQRLAPASARGLPGRRAAALALSLGAGILIAGTLKNFTSHGTTLDPTEPHKTSTLLTTGTNKISRNPLYLAMATLLSAHAAYRGTARTWLPVIGFVAVVDRLQIPQEERALKQLFGSAWDDYLRATPRWVGRPAGKAGRS